MTLAPTHALLTVGDLRVLVRRDSAPRTVPDVAPEVRVFILSAHPAAGASTVALALAEAAPEAGATQLVDLAEPSESGLICAADHEYAPSDDEWRSGSRGTLQIHRRKLGAGSAAEVSDLPELEAGRQIVDVGRPIRDVLGAPGLLSQLLSTAVLVVVGRATVPGVRQIEAALTALQERGKEPFVVAVGDRRWPGCVTASAGPRLRAAQQAERVVGVPLDRRLAIEGIDASPLPKAVAAAAAELARRIWPDVTGDVVRRKDSWR